MNAKLATTPTNIGKITFSPDGRSLNGEITRLQYSAAFEVLIVSLGARQEEIDDQAEFIFHASKSHDALVDLLRDVSGTLQPADPMKERILRALVAAGAEPQSDANEQDPIESRDSAELIQKDADFIDELVVLLENNEINDAQIMLGDWRAELTQLGAA